jgi:N-acetyl sugar amidotransferase
MEKTKVSKILMEEEEQGARCVEYCSKCLMPDSRPRIFFDENGVCSACNFAMNRGSIDWSARQNELLSILEPFRSTTGDYDCVVPWSGGKDSSVVAWRLKHEFGMNPLLVTASPMMPSEEGYHNREAMIQAGFDHLYFRPDQNVQRKLAKRFFVERGNPKVAWNASINIPMRIAVNFNIRLVFYAEHGESYYGGKMLRKDSNKIRDFTEAVEHQIEDDPRNWVDEVITINDLQPYIYPGMEEISRVGITAYFLGYFIKWSSYENYKFIKNKIDFRNCSKGRSCGTFIAWDSIDDKIDDLYFYMQYIKFGFGRAVRDASRQIQNGHISREEGLELAKKYDDEFPHEYFDEVLKYLDITDKEFHEIVDKHRNPEIWEKEDGVFKLRYPLI